MQMVALTAFGEIGNAENVQYCRQLPVLESIMNQSVYKALMAFAVSRCDDGKV